MNTAEEIVEESGTIASTEERTATNEVRDEEAERDPIVPKTPLHLRFRSGRTQQQNEQCFGEGKKVFRVIFGSLGLWKVTKWNFIPWIIIGGISVYQFVYDLYVVCGCKGFDCGFVQNATEGKPGNHPDRKTANTTYTLGSLGAVTSYLLLTVCFVISMHKRQQASALIVPVETFDHFTKFQRKLLCFSFVFNALLFVSSVLVFYVIIWASQPRGTYFDILVTGVGAQFLAQWAAIVSCHVFAASSFALGNSQLHFLATKLKIII